MRNSHKSLAVFVGLLALSTAVQAKNKRSRLRRKTRRIQLRSSATSRQPAVL